jgi:hypothetical protein
MLKVKTIMEDEMGKTWKEGILAAAWKHYARTVAGVRLEPESPALVLQCATLQRLGNLVIEFFRTHRLFRPLSQNSRYLRLQS